MGFMQKFQKYLLNGPKIVCLFLAESGVMDSQCARPDILSFDKSR